MHPYLSWTSYHPSHGYCHPCGEKKNPVGTPVNSVGTTLFITAPWCVCQRQIRDAINTWHRSRFDNPSGAHISSVQCVVVSEQRGEYLSPATNHATILGSKEKKKPPLYPRFIRCPQSKPTMQTCLIYDNVHAMKDLHLHMFDTESSSFQRRMHVWNEACRFCGQLIPSLKEMS